MDALELLVDQHADLADRFDRLTWAAPPARAALLADLIHALDAHLTAEDHLLYPRVAARLGRVMLSRARAAGLACEEILHRLCALDPDEPRFAAIVAALAARFQRAADEEDQHIFPAIGDRMRERELGKIGAAITEHTRAIVDGAAARDAARAAPARPVARLGSS